MTRAPLTQQQVLGKAVRALGGTWDTQRAVTTLRDAGYRYADQRAAEKRARALLGFLAHEGFIVRVDPRRETYRVAERCPS